MSSRSAARYFRTPKGLLIILLVAIAAIATAGQGVALAAPGIIASIVAGALVDLIALRLRDGKWLVPDGAILTGLIVAMILTPHEPWYVAAITTAIGVLSKYLLRLGNANIFNPAALALVLTSFVFHTGQSWWGALPELPLAATVVVIAAGIFITDRVNKMPAALAFLGSYYLLATATSFIGDPAGVAELYRAPDLQMAIFFAFFMVTDPPTSPAKHREQVIFGLVVGVTSYAAFELIDGAAYYPLAGLLVGNAWEAWRRDRARSKRRSKTRVAPALQ